MYELELPSLPSWILNFRSITASSSNSPVGEINIVGNGQLIIRAEAFSECAYSTALFIAL